VPRVKLVARNLDETTRFQPIVIRMAVTDFISDKISSASRDCSYTTRILSVGTLEYLRLFDVCKVELTGYTATTDKNGVAAFNDF
jgi:hypothetical protein